MATISKLQINDISLWTYSEIAYLCLSGNFMLSL